MKAIQVNANITSASTRGKTQGVRLSIITPELNETEIAELMKLVNANIICLFQPMDEPNAPLFAIDKALESKTPSERLRGVLYVYWQQQGEKGDFNDFYRKSVERFIDSIKAKLI